MARYFLTKERLRKDLKLITLEDHQWHLRHSDENFAGVVKSLDPPLEIIPRAQSTTSLPNF